MIILFTVSRDIFNTWHLRSGVWQALIKLGIRMSRYSG